MASYESYVVFTSDGLYPSTARDAADAVNRVARYWNPAEIYGAMREDLAVHGKPPEPKRPAPREFTVSFTATIGAHNTLTADDIKSYVQDVIVQWSQHIASWSDVTVTPVEAAASEPEHLAPWKQDLRNACAPPAVPLLPWDLARAGAAALRDTGTWEYPVAPPADSPEDDESYREPECPDDESWELAYREADCF